MNDSISKIDFFNMFLEWISKHWILITALFTLITSLIGIVSSTIYYSGFNISYIEFAETSDFIRDGILRPHIAIFAFILYSSFLIVLLKASFEFHKLIKAKKNTVNYKINKKELAFKIAQFTIFIILFIIIISNPSKFYDIDSERVKSEISVLYNVHANEKNLVCVSHIGRISNYQIFWNSQTFEAIMIQNSSIKSIIPKVKMHYNIDPHGNTVMVLPHHYEEWKESVKKECGSTFNISKLKDPGKMLM